VRLRRQPPDFAYFLNYEIYQVIQEGGVTVDSMKSSACKKQLPPGASGRDTLEEITTYTIKGKTFIVEPVFKENSKDTIGSILMRLTQSDRGKA